MREEAASSSSRTDGHGAWRMTGRGLWAMALLLVLVRSVIAGPPGVTAAVSDSNTADAGATAVLSTAAATDGGAPEGGAQDAPNVDAAPSSGVEEICKI